MKTYKEMAESVFRRRERYKEEQGRRREAVKAWLVCVLFALMLSCVGSVLLIQGSRPEDVVLVTNPYEASAGTKENIQESSDATDQIISFEVAEATEAAKKRSVELCLLDAYTKKEEPLREGIKFPLNMYLELEDTSGFTREEESEASKEKWRKLSRIQKEIGDKAWANLLVGGDEDTLLAFYSIGGFVLNIDDYDTIDCFTLKGTSNGKVGIYLVKDNQYPCTNGDLSVDITAEQLCYNFADYKYGINVMWDPSYLMRDRICDNPEIDLSEINDTMQIIIWYINGEMDVYTIDIFFDQDGVGYAMIAEDEVAQ